MVLIDSLSPGGAQRVTATLCRYLSSRGIGVTLVTLRSSETDGFDPGSGVKKIHLGLVAERSLVDKVSINLKRLRSIRQLIRQERPSLVIGMMTSCATLAILATRGLNVKAIVSERNYPGRKKVFQGWHLLRKLLYRFADGHVAQTREVARWIERHAGARNVVVIPNSVTWPIPEAGTKSDPEAWLEQGRRCILGVGTKIEQKGFDLLVKAFAGIAGENPGWDLVILGTDGDSRLKSAGGASLRTVATDAGIASRVYLPGLVGNVMDWYERADIFVLSSRYEGFPNALLEAMACGCACIAFDCDTGPRDIIHHEVDGLLVEPEDVERLARAMSGLMTNAERRARLAAQAQYVRERYHEATVMNQWVGFMEGVAGNSLPSMERSIL